ncbi:hypothetical protein GCM10020256_54470 [Streptomyces thermocoprophilus]
MIRFESVSVTYDGAAEPTVRGIDFEVPEGELVLLAGPSGVGKSTVLGAVSGLVPHFTGGTLAGRVTVAGRDTRTHKPRELADVVGTVGQDPLSHFVTDTVEDELAYGMESLGLPPDVMRRRVEETLDLLGLAPLRDRPLATLSGGQQQRVAIGSVLTPHPRVLVLDEPTSALDPAAAEEVLAVVQRLVHDLGTTVLMAEHRLERVVQYADRIALLPAPGAPLVVGGAGRGDGRVAGVSAGRRAGPAGGWTPLPLTVRDARRRAEPLRERLAEHAGDGRPGAGAGDAGDGRPGAGAGDAGSGDSGLGVGERAGTGPAVAGATPAPPAKTPPHTSAGWTRRLFGRASRRAATEAPAESAPVAEVTGLGVRRGRVEALRRVDLALSPGETVALMGRNGAGKSTLLGSLVGLVRPTSGTVRVGGVVPYRTPPQELVRRVGLVPQEPRDLLYAETVAAECAAADRDAEAAPGTCRALVGELLPGVADGTHPRDLSEGQRLALALAVVLAARPPLVLLDEPTRGLDYAAKARLITHLRALARDGRTIVLATHDVELAAELADRVVLLAEGEVIADGPTADVVVSSPSFAPPGDEDPRAAAVADRGPGAGGAAMSTGRKGAVERGRTGPESGLPSDRQARAVRLGPRSVAALLLVTAVGGGGVRVAVPRAARFAAQRALAGRAVAVRGSAGAARRGGHGDDLRVGPRPEGRRDGRRAGGDRRGAAADRRGHGGPGADVLPDGAQRAGARAGFRVRAGLGDDVRVGAAHRWGGPVAAVPDAGDGLVHHGRGPVAGPGPAAGPGRGADAGRVRLRGRLRLRHGDEHGGLALHGRAGLGDLLRAGRAGRDEPGAFRRVLPGHVHGLGPGPGDGDGRAHRGAGPGGAEGTAQGDTAGGVRDRRHIPGARSVT